MASPGRAASDCQPPCGLHRPESAAALALENCQGAKPQINRDGVNKAIALARAQFHTAPQQNGGVGGTEQKGRLQEEGRRIVKIAITPNREVALLANVYDMSDERSYLKPVCSSATPIRQWKDGIWRNY